MILKRTILQRCTCLCRVLCSQPIRAKAYLTDSLSTEQDDEVERNFKPRKFLLLRKITRYEFEKQHANTDSEEKLKSIVSHAVLTICRYDLLNCIEMPMHMLFIF